MCRRVRQGGAAMPNRARRTKPAGGSNRVSKPAIRRSQTSSAINRINNIFENGTPELRALKEKAFADRSWHQPDCLGCAAFEERHNRLGWICQYAWLYKGFLKRAEEGKKMKAMHSLKPKKWGCSTSETSSSLRNTTIDNKSWHSGNRDLREVHIAKSSLTRVTLENCYIHDSSLKDCKLTNCEVDYSIPENCVLVRCTIASQSIIHSSRMFSCRVEESKIKQCKGYRSFFYDSRIYGGRLENCVTDNVECTGVNVQVSELRETYMDGKCTLFNTNMLNCESAPRMKIEDTRKRNERRVSWKPLNLRRFAPEIRIMIFEYAIGGDTKQGSVLLKELRGIPELYVEGLEVMNRTCAFRIQDQKNSLLEYRLHPNLKKSLQHLFINPGMLNCLTWNKFAHGLDGVKSIHFENDGEGYTINHGSIIEFLECTHFSGTSSSLNTVSIGIMDCLSADPYMFYSAADGVWSCKETLELLLGTARVLEGGEKTTLIWRAKAGGVLVRKSSSHLASEPIVETH